MTGHFVKILAAVMAISFPLVRPSPVPDNKKLNGKMHQLVDEFVLSSLSRSENRTLLTDIYGVVWKSSMGDEIGVKIIYSGEDPNANAASALEPVLLDTGACKYLDCRDYMCAGWCDISALGKGGVIETLSEVSHILLGAKAETNAFTGSGTIKTQAIAATQINTMLRKYPELTGKGVKVGIISDSFNSRAGDIPNPDYPDYDKFVVSGTSEETDIESGNLPGGKRRVKVLIEPDPDFKFLPSDEGRAMAQVLYDLVPDAEIVFRSGFLNVAGFIGSGIEDLVEEGCDIIIDDIRADGFEPVFQLGPTPKAAEKAVNDHGVAYFTVARNFGSRSWEGRGYKDTSCPDYDFFQHYVSCHDFGNGKAFQRITQAGLSSLTFYWDDPWFSVSGLPGPKTDLDIFAFDVNGGMICSTEVNAGGDAVEQIRLPRGTYNFVIAKYSGPSPSIIKWIDVGVFSSVPTAESSTLTGIGLAPSVAAVGAASEKQVFGQLELQSYSSRGGIPLVFDDKGNRFSQELIPRQPRFVAPDGSYNTFLGALEPFEFSLGQFSGFVPPRFYGTSCSVVNAAAVGAILFQAMSSVSKNRRRLSGKAVKSSKKKAKDDDVDPDPDAEQENDITGDETEGDIVDDVLDENNIFSIPFDIYQIMEDTAIDMNEAGYDFLSGYGHVNALAAVEMVFEKLDKDEKGTKGNKAKKKTHKKRNCPVQNFLHPIGSYIDDSYAANATVYCTRA